MAAKDEFTLTVTNEKGVMYYGPCELVFLPSQRGETAVMRHHTPMIMKLTPGKVRMKTSSGTQDIATVTSGLAYVAEDVVSVLVDL
ncbi:MAG: F0F1 ATP synthase subunit epsilon [Candidatus Nomurabacteria bacterium]|nr:MAG: F0F1 ATP synthase subunit epsilon [Candidatus Nomurabacteria bacterium]